MQTITAMDGVAAGSTRVRAYLKERLLAAFGAEPKLALSFMAMLAHEIMALRARLEVRNVRSARERILQHLGLIAETPHIFRLDRTLKNLAAERTKHFTEHWRRWKRGA
jgi:CRP-like cAMP-binding protein